MSTINLAEIYGLCAALDNAALTRTEVQLHLNVFSDWLTEHEFPYLAGLVARRQVIVSYAHACEIWRGAGGFYPPAVVRVDGTGGVVELTFSVDYTAPEPYTGSPYDVEDKVRHASMTLRCLDEGGPPCEGLEEEAKRFEEALSSAVLNT